MARLESLCAAHAAKYRREKGKRRGKNGLEKGERRADGAINESPGLNYGVLFLCLY